MAEDLNQIPVAAGDTVKAYIVLSQTGALMSNVLHICTRAPYNHVSLSFDKNLHMLHSFGRRNPFDPFWGGVVRESPHWGTFKRFHKTRIKVMEVTVPREKRDEVQAFALRMWHERETWGYNYSGVFLGAVGIHHPGNRTYYCSEFVKDMAVRMGVEGADRLPDIVQPIHFLSITHEVIYEGLLTEYTPPYRP